MEYKLVGPFKPPAAFFSSIELLTLVGVWVEVLLYGIYTCLFFESLYIILKKRKTQTFSGKIFLTVVSIMYLVATTHIGLSLYRILGAFIWSQDIVRPGIYLLDVGNWVNFAPVFTFWLMTWLGDALVIYRCFVIWNQNYAIIVLPSILLIFSIAVNAVIMFWILGPFADRFAELMIWIKTVYPITFAQNILTTGLIVFKILRRYRGSTAAGVRNAGSPLRLIHVVRILVESAMLYTVPLFVMIVLNHRGLNAQIIVQCALVPIIGIAINLIAVRIHRTESETLQGIGTDVLAGISRMTDDHSSCETEVDHPPYHHTDEEAPPIRLKRMGSLACTGIKGGRHNRSRSI
ncbi:hypothetical protein BDZ94DRAFT_1258300 [Collybia nuda]|uniref:Uncharacterized protein n=1 Tax=Collybia nuda TaxID=64659 RepID=A0A9P5Y7I3_9AGAR|nr:hypothetical protein BDZ94DRAFT_1258300 [Collybia nuda]